MFGWLHAISWVLQYGDSGCPNLSRATRVFPDSRRLSLGRSWLRWREFVVSWTRCRSDGHICASPTPRSIAAGFGCDARTSCDSDEQFAESNPRTSGVVGGLSIHDAASVIGTCPTLVELLSNRVRFFAPAGPSHSGQMGWCGSHFYTGSLTLVARNSSSHWGGRA